MTVVEIIESGNYVLSDRLLFKKELENGTLGRWIARINVGNYRIELGNKWAVDFGELQLSVHDLIL